MHQEQLLINCIDSRIKMLMYHETIYLYKKNRLYFEGESTYNYILIHIYYIINNKNILYIYI